MDDKIKTNEQSVHELIELRKRAEAASQEKSLALPDISRLSTAETQQLFLSNFVRPELKQHNVRQIELKMQNEELRRTQRELGELLDRYQDLYDFAPVGNLWRRGRGYI